VIAETPKAPPPKPGRQKGNVVSDGVTVAWERFAAVSTSHGPHPALILLHGVTAVAPADSVLEQAARKLAARGYEVEVLQYLVGDPRTNFGPWMRTVGDAITQLASTPGVDSTKIGLIGVNVGAAVALHRAQVDTRVRAVVDYFGVYRVRDNAFAAKLPPVLIVGGDAEAQRLDALLKQYNVPHEMVEPALAPQRVVDFLRRYLPPN
jgi:carboxymethylenebutenolidase